MSTSFYQEDVLIYLLLIAYFIDYFCSIFAAYSFLLSSSSVLNYLNTVPPESLKFLANSYHISQENFLMSVKTFK